MEKNIILENNLYLEKFFSHLKIDKELVYKIICENTKTFIYQTPHKIKQVKDCKYKNKTIYEYKLKLPKQAYRLAYIFDGDDIRIFYISKTLIKADFTKEIAKVV
ncbi:hypothetical protein [Campylobacter estrildidarum]|uniref:Type II toxin-antitoxin system RelE/ParE family toxin n=1 Tax=Campylobacter estrildidarum TaxID=2510189 RepID=A0A4U7BQX6_9BACT|nr:hypothetical protein [Campylobacter estrildidarum]TKX31094.1 hypothetical protein CQA69_03895 [Campylobacter estrildidarum]